MKHIKNLFCLLLLCSSLTAFAQKTDFSGNWQLNKAKTNFGSAPESAVPSLIKAQQQVGKLILARVYPEAQPVNDTLQLNAAPFQRISTSGSRITLTAQYINDHSIEITQKGNQVIADTWTLEDNGKTLAIERHVQQANGLEFTIKAYYSLQ